jgi:uncharacterized protein YceK
LTGVFFAVQFHDEVVNMRINAFCLSFTAIIALSGCASAPQPEVAPAPKSSYDTVKQAIVVAEAYCKNLGENQGIDYPVCFKNELDTAITQIEAAKTKAPATAK